MIDLSTPAIRIKGRAAKEPAVAVVRDLLPADLELLATEKQVRALPLKRLRDVHHSLARLLASGESESIAAAICGYSISRVSILKADPSFRELLKFYQEKVSENSIEAVADFVTSIANTAKLANEVIQERLEETPENFENEELRKLVETAADRAGFAPPKAKGLTVTINLAERLAAGRERAARAKDHVIEVEASQVFISDGEEPTP